MESESVKILRRGYEAFNRGDFDAAVEAMHPDIEMQRAEMAPDPGTLQGVEALRAWMKPDIFEQQLVELEDIVENGEKILVSIRARVRARASGIEFEDRGFHVWTVRDGKAVRMEFYADRTEARKAAGLD